MFRFYVSKTDIKKRGTTLARTVSEVFALPYSIKVVLKVAKFQIPRTRVINAFRMSCPYSVAMYIAHCVANNCKVTKNNRSMQGFCFII